MGKSELTNGHSKRVLGVGIVGCGEITQVVHIPTLGFLSEDYRIVYLCDVSQDAMKHCAQKVQGGAPETSANVEDLCASFAVDVVLITNSTEYHADHAICALKHNKSVFVEKPVAMTLKDVDRLKQAEQDSQGTLMVGYMRRYASAFVDAVKEVGGLDKILYARVRDIIGPNSAFVDQSGTFPKRFSDFPSEASIDKDARSKELLRQALETELGVEVNPANTLMWQLLGGLGSHDLSAMREVLGMPKGVHGAHRGFPFWSVLFDYGSFAVSYESGIDNVPRFDAHIEVYSESKSVRVEFDSPYIKGLPTTLHIRENVDGAYKETMIRKTYEDAYTTELKELYRVVTTGEPAKTTIDDSRDDFAIFGMIMTAGKQSLSNGHKQSH